MKKSSQKKLTLDQGIIHALSHDLKQPLSLIRAYSYYIQKNLPPLSKNLSIYTEKINSSVDQLTAMLNNLVESIKLESDQAVLKKEPVDITQVLEALLDELQPLYSDVTFTFDSPPARTEVSGDQAYLRLAFYNILVNAAIFSDKSAPVTLSIATTSDQVVLSCSNTGFGVPASEVALVQYPYYKGPNVDSTTPKGLGVGLYVAHQVILKHQGTLLFESTPTYNTVTITLPKT